MKVTFQGGQVGLVLFLEGEVDHENVDELVGAFQELAQSASTDTTLDFAGVTYIDSAGISAIYDFTDRWEGQSPVRIAGLSRDLRRIFHISGLLLHDRLWVENEGKDTTVAATETAASHSEALTASWSRSFPSSLDQLKLVRAFVEEVAESVALEESRRFDLKVAVSEAAANAIEHGLNEGDFGIEAIRHSDRITVTVSDRGDFHPRPAHDPTRSHRGMGLPLMLGLTDELTVSSRPDGGTSVSLSVFLERPGEAAPREDDSPFPS